MPASGKYTLPGLDTATSRSPATTTTLSTLAGATGQGYDSPDLARPPRLLSLDLVRGADVWLMLFVNEMAGVRGTPAWLMHKPPTADGMSLTDVVFPAFLFITGMAVPLALGGRLRRGEPAGGVWRHVLGRVAALLVMGVFMVNGEHVAAQGILPGPLWNLLAYLALVLVFAVPPARSEDAPALRGRWRAVRLAGIVLLLLLALLYRAEGAPGLLAFRPRWWGILGLIGWAYLVAAAGYLLARERPALLLGGVSLLYVLALADESNALGVLLPVRALVSVGAMLGAHGGLALSGTLLTVAFLLARRDGADGRRFTAAALGYAAGMAAAGLLLHSMHGLGPAFWINKVKATVAWCLLSAAITVA